MRLGPDRATLLAFIASRFFNYLTGIIETVLPPALPPSSKLPYSILCCRHSYALISWNVFKPLPPQDTSCEAKVGAQTQFPHYSHEEYAWTTTY
jgi:hypothetical protein